MSRKFIVHDLATGEIVRRGVADEDNWADQAQPGQGMLESDADPRHFRVVEGEIVERPALALSKTDIAADGADEAVADVPAGTRVYARRGTGANGDRGWSEHFAGETEGEPFVFTAIEPGAYRIRLVPAFPWQVLDVEVVAT